MKIKKAIIPSAGFGTRFLPVTKALPKVMLPIIDKPAIHYLVDEAVASGIEEIIIITGQNKNLIRNYFNKSKELEEHLAQTGRQDLLDLIQRIHGMAKIRYVTQGKALGLGHAIYCARNLIGKDEMFAVLLGDDIVQAEQPCLSQLIKIFTQYQGNIIGVQYVPDKEVGYYGIVTGKNISDKLIEVADLVEKPNKGNEPSNLAIMGRYILHSDIFSILGNTRPGKGGEIQLTDALRELKKNHQLFAYVFEGNRYDLGDKLGYLKANFEFALQDNEIREEFNQYLSNILENGMPR
ncbi:MAG TPA: UTP--glucose-1-phosphate uridylyltransferase GalU [Candidatus Deferrimicrobium sp.]|nr:UTP--glucose-1-phosphate uridylyltransferase GalU [Candidatus Deferrimicrobium sp.]